jgi:V/A-type H+-transporting ATPase subunit C
MMAKVRARYGRRLQDEDYKQLMACHNVSEIAGYLKTRQGYRSVLAQVQEEMVHRGQVESLIRRRILNFYTQLLKYSYSDRLFLDLYIGRSEISQLLLAMRYLNAGEMDRYIVSLPVYLARFTRFDLFALAKVHDFDGLLDLLERTDYYEIVGQFRPYASGQIDIVGCERALDTYYYSVMTARVEKEYRGKTREDILGLLHWQIDFHNLSVIYRLKRYFGYKPEQIRASLIDVASGMSKTIRERLINAEGTDELLDAIRGLRSLRGLVGDAAPSTLEIVARLDHLRLTKAQRPLRFSTRPVVVVVAYMTILELELSNIVHIIEGVHYGVPPEEMYKLLVI